MAAEVEPEDWKEDDVAGELGELGHDHAVKDHGEACCDHDHGSGSGHDHGSGHGQSQGHGHSSETSTTTSSAQATAPVANTNEVPKVADLFTLARQQNFPIAIKILDAHPQLWHERDDDGHSLLHWAALVGNEDFVKLGLAKGLQVDGLASNKQTPLMWGALRGHITTVKVLADAKGNVQAHDSLGATPLIIAVQHRQYLMALFLMHRGKDSLLGDSDKNGCTSQHWAAYKGDEMALKILDYFGADLTVHDNSKMMPIHRAVFASQVCVVKFLVDKRSDLHARNADGKTPMDIAVTQEDQGMQMMLKKLMKEGAEADPESLLPEDGKAKDKGGVKSMLKDKAMQKIFPVFWLVCVALAVFQYLMDLRDTGWKVAPTASLLFEFGIPASLAIFAFTALSNPGIVPSKPRGHSGVEELQRALDGPPGTKVPDISRLCTTTWVLKDLRTKYCQQTGACVSEFDHYCVWLNCAIGKGNHRQFCFLAITEWCTQLTHLYLLINLAGHIVEYKTFGNWIFNVVMGYPLLALIFTAHLLTAPWVMMLVLHQFRLIAQNLTTNEMMNAARYDHFWTVQMGAPGRLQKVFRNPFHKGSLYRNCMDFWWRRQRTQLAEDGGMVIQQACCNHDHGSGHGHSH